MKLRSVTFKESVRVPVVNSTTTDQKFSIIDDGKGGATIEYDEEHRCVFISRPDAIRWKQFIVPIENVRDMEPVVPVAQYCPTPKAAKSA